jgi:spermidine/putrescine transport system substrate-binding protein
LLGLGGTATLLAACGAEASPPPSDAPSPSPVPSTGLPRPSVGSELAIYDWSDNISPDNLAEFGARFGVTDIRHESFGSHQKLLDDLKAGSTGFDICCPSAEYLPKLVEQGYIQKLDFARIPNARLVDPAFEHLWWDPAQEYHVPKDYGDTTGILYRGDSVALPPRSWREFDALVQGPASGKTVFVDSMDDVFVYPLKMLGHSLNSVDAKELKEARKILLTVAPHVLAIDSDTYGARLASGEAVLALGWTGPLFAELATPETDDAGYVVPAEGSLFRLDAWTLLADAPHADAAYAWLDFIQEPAIQAEESNYNGYATANDEARPLVDPGLLADPAIFPPAAVIPKLEAARDHSANAQRLDIWEEFKAKVAAA